MLKFYRVLLVLVLLVATWPLMPTPVAHAQSYYYGEEFTLDLTVDTEQDIVFTTTGTMVGYYISASTGVWRHAQVLSDPFVGGSNQPLNFVNGWGAPFCWAGTGVCSALGIYEPGFNYWAGEIAPDTEIAMRFNSDGTGIFTLVVIYEGVPTPTPTPTTPPTPVLPQPGIPNFLENGNFELPLEGNWELGADVVIPALPQDIIYSAGPGRVNENDAGFTGGAYCASYYGLVRSTGISQRFDWPGGTMYIQYRVRRKLADGERSYPQIELGLVAGGYTILTTPLFDGKEGEFIDREAGDDDWQLNQHTISLPAGTYDFIAYNVDYEGTLQVGTFSTGTPTIPTGPDGFIYEGRASHDYEIDDVTVSLNSYLSLCSGGGGPTITPIPSTTPTPTNTRTPGPSPTRTNTRTPGPTPTGTNAGTAFPPSNYANCNFENGSSAWAGSNFSIKLAGGPVGPQYAEVRAPGIMHQNFTWGITGNAYVTFWVGPGSYGEIAIRNTSTNISTPIWVGTNDTAGWILRSAVRGNLQAGSYRLEVRPYGSGFISIDGLQIARNTYAFCGSNNGNPITPTNGPTAFVSPTITRTPSPGPTPTQRPPTNTFTPGPTRTPFPTWTPQPSGTPTTAATATNTPANDATATSQAATSTAQASITPTPTPNATSTPPPQQPEPQPYADCIRPTNPVDLAGWGEYGTCVALTWFVWTPDNTQQVLDLRELLDDREPFGTIGEIVDTFELVRDFSESINWDNTGLTCARQPVVTDWIVADATGLLNGEFEISEGPDIASTCALNGADAIMGTNISAGVCYTTNLLCYYGIMPWLQLFVNAGFIALGLAYIRMAWIAKATQS